jgi:hypothetical protein
MAHPVDGRFVAAIMATLLVAGCVTYDQEQHLFVRAPAFGQNSAPPLSAQDMAQKCKQQEAINFWTADCLAWKHQRDAELDAKNKAAEAERAAYWAAQREQQATQQKETERQEVEAVKRDEREGYRPITFEDFALDASEIKGAKVSIRGLYVDKGERLFRDPRSVILWIQYGESGKGVSMPLLTENASREARATFLRCANANIPVGCGIVIRGRVESLTLRNRLGVERQELGIAVETVRP